MPGWLKGLIASACVALITAVGYYFWGEYREYRRALLLAEAARQSERDRLATFVPECDAAVIELRSWIAGSPNRAAASFSDARDAVDRCLKLQRDTEWYTKNVAVKYW